ncbi:MAG: CinA family nicotinamide mononucleotide deamidase-related protein [Pseudomonadota bacterium]
MENKVWAEVVTIGSELVLGQLVDTNASFIASSLAEIGVGLAYHTTVGDDWDRMLEALKLALSRADIVITTGGIGPTEDDFTREAAAAVLGVELEMRPDLLEFIEGLFRRMKYKMAPNNRKQANIPRGAEVIHNPRGTAPAFRAEKDGRVLICLPGVPFETEPLIREAVLPYLKERFTPGGRLLVNRVLKVCGVGESNVDNQIKQIIRSSKNPIIGLQASPGEIKVRLTALADDEERARELLDQGEAQIRAIIGDLIFGQGDETLPGVTARLLEDRGLTLAVVEVPSGGTVAAELNRRLNPGTLRGAMVLEKPLPAAELAEKALADFQADVALVVSGNVDQDGQAMIEILVRDRTGRQSRRDLPLGGPRRLIMDRSGALALFTLWGFLKELP